MNVYEFAKMLSESTGVEVRGFQSFIERPDEKRKIEEILSGDGTPVNLESFMAGEIKPSGLLILYLDGQSHETSLYEMDSEVSERWRGLNRSEAGSTGNPIQ